MLGFFTATPVGHRAASYAARPFARLGGPFLEDFRLVHSRIGIGRKRNGRTVGKLTCIESELEVHKRQRFNKPVATIKCVHSTLEQFLDKTRFSTPAIIWFDYTAPRGVASQIQRFAATVGTVPVGSVLRVTLNANPTSLGGGGEEPSGKDLSVEVDGDVSPDRAQKPTKAEWRFEQFKQRLGTLVPSGLTADAMTFKKYGPTLLQVLKLAVEKKAIWSCSAPVDRLTTLPAQPALRTSAPCAFGVK